MNPWDLHELASRLKKNKNKQKQEKKTLNEQNVIILARFLSEMAFKFHFM